MKKWLMMVLGMVTLGLSAGELETYTKECDKGSASACMELGVLYYHGRGVDKNISKSVNLFTSACDNNNMMACVDMGLSYRDAVGVEKNTQKAIELFSMACEHNETFGCYVLGRTYEQMKEYSKGLKLHLNVCDGIEKSEDRYSSCNQIGQIYRNGNGVEQDYTKAVKYYRKSCLEDYDEIGCENLGDMYKNAWGVDKNISKAMKYYKKGCSTENASSCNELGLLYGASKVWAKDKQAFKYYELACQGEDSYGCNNVGIFYLQGKGVELNLERGLKFLNKSCNEMDNKIACSHLGDAYRLAKFGVKHNDAKAIPYYLKSCAKGKSEDCLELAIMYENGEGSDKNISKSAIYYDKSCEKGNANGCYNLGYYYDNQTYQIKDKPKAIVAYRKACDMKIGVACYGIGYLYNVADGVVVDQKKALSYYTKACDYDYMEGCYAIGQLYLKGQGVSKDIVQAKKFLKKSCEGNLTIGCQTLSLLNKADNSTITNHNDRVYNIKKCKMGDMDACNNLGVIYQNSKTDRDISKAKEYYTKACDGAYMVGCFNLGYLYSLDKDMEKKRKSVALYQRACDENVSQACGNLGFAYKKGIGVEKNSTKALILYKKACDDGGGVAQFCSNIGYLYREQNKTTKSKEYFLKACTLNHGESCYALSRDYVKEKDFKKARYFTEVSCNHNFIEGCWVLANLSFREKDYEKAFVNYNKVIAINPNVAKAYLGLGYIYGVQKRYQKGIESYKRALELDIKKRDEALYSIGFYYSLLEDYKNARSYYYKSIEHGNRRFSTYLNLFELEIIDGINFNKEIEKKFKEISATNNSGLDIYRMLKSLNDIAHGKEVNLKELKFKSKVFWNYDFLTKWANTHKKKVKLLKSIEFFKLLKAEERKIL